MGFNPIQLTTEQCLVIDPLNDRIVVWKTEVGEVWERTFADPTVDVTQLDTTEELIDAELPGMLDNDGDPYIPTIDPAPDPLTEDDP